MKRKLIGTIAAISLSYCSSLYAAEDDWLSYLEYDYYAKVSGIGLIPNSWQSSFQDNDLEFLKFPFGISGSLGSYLNRYLRAEVSAMWLFDITTKPKQGSDTSDANIINNHNNKEEESSLLALNSGVALLRGYIDLVKIGPVSIFIGGGGGASYTGGTVENHKIDYKLDFYKEAIVGVSVEITDEVYVDAEYKYMWISCITGENVNGKPYTNFKPYDFNGHSLSAGVRFSF
ncbi:outer membrane beta-barrel domain protein [Orientia chuto str. Dubai]|uniref:Outer membrane beta-barrel domain protein n=1 Tax=Orientia chuto str. Dubai TaxID=1359168 RepID=A0A0F3MM37_9RICK|nr:outer membrane beta-barrel protein [Candidatus Orientia mediorientalis]KJV56537.1 outer membrane beta-barrel domain protein [Orientia chuto str. Dubai]